MLVRTLEIEKGGSFWVTKPKFKLWTWTYESCLLTNIIIFQWNVNCEDDMLRIDQLILILQIFHNEWRRWGAAANGNPQSQFTVGRGKRWRRRRSSEISLQETCTAQKYTTVQARKILSFLLRITFRAHVLSFLKFGAFKNLQVFITQKKIRCPLFWMEIKAVLETSSVQYFNRNHKR